MTLLDIIYMASPWVAGAIVGANWKAIVWGIKTVIGKETP